MKINLRSLHRDLGYFYVGLIISFASSGILMNHRQHWHPEKYTIEIEQKKLKPFNVQLLNDSVANDMLGQLNHKDKFKRQSVKKGSVRIVCENSDVEIDPTSGFVEITKYQSTPIISQTFKLHKNTSNWWIYYSDIFGLSLITIAVTGTLILARSKYSFKRRGWKLALLGVIFPLLFLLLIN